VTFTDVLPAAVGLYGAYWAFSIRRALASGVYRRHALWLGFLTILIAVLLPIASVSTTNVIVALGINLAALASLVSFFAFIDTTVPIARRSDPLLRPILRWNKVRLVLWADLGLAAIYLVISGIDPASTSAGLAAAIGFPVFLLPFIMGAPAITIGALRSKDSLLRGSLMWCGGFLAVFLVNALLSFVVLVALGISAYDASFSYPALVFAPGSILRMYCLYRSARSLAPINELPRISLVPPHDGNVLEKVQPPLREVE